MNVFNPICTGPPDQPGIVASANIRGTFDIAWSCLAVVLLCTWAVLHENVPVEGSPKGWRQQAWFGLYVFACKAASFLMALLGPELFTGKAIMCFYFADYGKRQMNMPANKNLFDGDWTLRHAFLANMGGWAIDFDGDLETPPATMTPCPEPETPTNVQTQPHRVASAGSSKGPDDSDEKEIRTLDELLQGDEEKGIIAGDQTTCSVGTTPSNRAPNTTPSSAPKAPSHADIQDNLNRWMEERNPDKWYLFRIPKVAKGNWEKSNTIGDIIKRAICQVSDENIGYHSPRSFFENLVALEGNIWVVDGSQLQYALECGIIPTIPKIAEDDIKDKSKGDWITKLIAILQVLWLWVQLIARKAQGLTSTQLEITTAAIAVCSVITYGLYWNKPKDISTRIHLKAARYPQPEEMIELARRGPVAVYFHRVHLVINNDVYHLRSGRDVAPWLFVGTAAAGMVFASVHFASWNSHFPSEGERLGWKLACSILVGLPLPVCLLMLTRRWFERRYKNAKLTIERAFSVTRKVMEVLYILARSFIMVEACRSLLYQPSDAFQATSVFDIPHV